MGRFSSTALLAAAVIGAAAPAALAQNRVRLDLGGSYHVNGFSGGAFLATETQGDSGLNHGPGSSGNGFLTFCLEENEFFTPGNTYYTEITTSAMNGGSGGGSPDELSPVTARMYLEFRNGGNFGGAANIGNGVNDDAESRSLQLAIWYSENENADFQGDSRAQNMYNWALGQGDTTIGDVRVMRLWSSWSSSGGFSGNSQDQLTLVPLPQAAWAGGACLAGVMAVGYIRRRKQLS